MEHKIEIFFCYAREDEPLRQGLEKQLRALRRQGLIDLWRDRDISAGEEWQRAIDKHLNSADIILLLVSPDFMDSDYCYSVEMKRAMERHEKGEAWVIPIILRPVYWHKAPFGKLQALPTDGKPVTSSVWHNQDEAFFDVSEGIRLAVEKVPNKREAKQLFENGERLYKQKRKEEALTAYEQALRLDPNLAVAYIGKGNILHEQNRNEEALDAFEQVLHLNPNNGVAYAGKGNALYMQGHSEEALAAYEQALRLDPYLAVAYNGRGNILHQRNRNEEALAAYEQALRLDPNLAPIYSNKGDALIQLKRYKEALAAYEQALRLEPGLNYASDGKSLTLRLLEQSKEA